MFGAAGCGRVPGGLCPLLMNEVVRDVPSSQDG
jgi:hypothetical protein